MAADHTTAIFIAELILLLFFGRLIGEAMTRIGRLSAPTPPKLRAFHRAKREVYARMRRLDLDARALMTQGLEAVD